MICILVLSSCKTCGYSLSGINIPADVKNISIQYFNNIAPLVNPTLSQRFTEELKDKFIRETSLSLVSQNGDFTIKGEIVDYKTESVGFDANVGSVKNRFTTSVKVQFECPKHKELNFTETFTKFQEFEASQNFQSVEASLSEAVNKQLVQEIFNKVALRW